MNYPEAKLYEGRAFLRTNFDGQTIWFVEKVLASSGQIHVTIRRVTRVIRTLRLHRSHTTYFTGPEKNDHEIPVNEYLYVESLTRLADTEFNVVRERYARAAVLTTEE